MLNALYSASLLQKNFTLHLSLRKGLQTPSNFWPGHNLHIQMWPPCQFHAVCCVANETDEEVTFVYVGCARVKSF